MEMSASEPVLDNEKDRRSRARKQTDNRQSGRRVRLFKTAFDFFCDVDLSMTRALKLKQLVEGLVPHRNIFTEMKKQKSKKLQCISVKLHRVCLLFWPPLPPSPALPPRGQQDQPLLFLLLNLLNVRTTRVKTFMIIYLNLMNSK